MRSETLTNIFAVPIRGLLLWVHQTADVRARVQVVQRGDGGRIHAKDIADLARGLEKGIDFEGKGTNDRNGDHVLDLCLHHLLPPLISIVNARESTANVVAEVESVKNGRRRRKRRKFVLSTSRQVYG
jgi:hypothetical protein